VYQRHKPPQEIKAMEHPAFVAGEVAPMRHGNDTMAETGE
jgi:hypothetical protein